MLSLNDYFKEDRLVTFISDRSMDFTLNGNIFSLTPSQKEMLNSVTGVSIDRVAWTRQVHGCEVLWVQEPLFSQHSLYEADALLTEQIGLPIAIRTADCLPIFIFDPYRKIIGLVHAGWRGSYKKILCCTIAQMVQWWDTNPRDLKITFGPAIRACCYKVGEEFLSYFSQKFYRRDHDLYFDLVLANRDQALELGVQDSNILDSEICTCCDSRFFSFRREGQKAGRMLSLMMLKE